MIKQLADSPDVQATRGSRQVRWHFLKVGFLVGSTALFTAAAGVRGSLFSGAVLAEPMRLAVFGVILISLGLLVRPAPYQFFTYNQGES